MNDKREELMTLLGTFVKPSSPTKKVNSNIIENFINKIKSCKSKTYLSEPRYRYKKTLAEVDESINKFNFDFTLEYLPLRSKLLFKFYKIIETILKAISFVAYYGCNILIKICTNISIFMVDLNEFFGNYVKNKQKERVRKIYKYAAKLTVDDIRLIKKYRS